MAEGLSNKIHRPPSAGEMSLFEYSLRLLDSNNNSSIDLNELMLNEARFNPGVIPLVGVLRAYLPEISVLKKDDGAGISQFDLKELDKLLTERRRLQHESIILERYSSALLRTLDADRNSRLTRAELQTDLPMIQRQLVEAQRVLLNRFEAIERPQLGFIRRGIMLDEIAAAVKKGRSANGGKSLASRVDSLLNQGAIVTSSMPLFGSPKTPLKNISPSAVIQGVHPDCVFMAALSSLSEQRPQDVLSLFKRSDNNVRANFPIAPGEFHTPSQAYPWDTWRAARATANGRWPSFLEGAMLSFVQSHKAYAANSEGYEIDQGIAVLTGHKSDVYNFGTFGWIYPKDYRLVASIDHLDAQLKLAQSNRRIVTALAGEKGSDGLQKNHAYGMLGYDSSKRIVTLRNPYGYGEPTNKWGSVRDGKDDGVFKMSLQEFVKRFDAIAIESNRRASLY